MQASVLPAGLRPEEHLEPELFEAVVVVGPARFEDLVPILIGVQLVSLVQPREVIHLDVSTERSLVITNLLCTIRLNFI